MPTFLMMISVLNEDHFLRASFLCKADQVEESSLCEFVNTQIAEPDKESFMFFVMEAWEAPEA